MRVYRINKITGAVRQVFGKPKEIAGKVLKDFNGFSERMGVAKIGSAIKAAPVVQKVGMAVATVAVAGGTAAGIVATHQPAPTPAQSSTPAITQTKAEETKPEEKVEETKPEEEKPAATEQPAAPEKPEYEQQHEQADDAPAANTQAEPAPAPQPAQPRIVGYKHILSAWNPDTNEIYRTSYGYDGEYNSREAAMQALIRMIQEGGKATPRGIEESEVAIYEGSN